MNLDAGNAKCNSGCESSVSSLEGIEVDTQLGSYRVQALRGGGERAFFAAAPEADGSSVCLLELRDDEVSAYAAAAAGKANHAHLALVREVFSHEGVSLLAFEQVEGVTLTERLNEIGRKPTVEAVGTALRVSDALSTLHDAGGVHGFIHTDSVLVDPPERLGPVLTFAPVPADERTFHSPERGGTGKPSVADDAWAAAGLLHMMLTGSPPPKQGYAATEELLEAGVEDPALCVALLHGLNADPKERSQDVRPLKRELARWFVEHAGEDQLREGTHSTLPPPLPAGRKAAVAAKAAPAGAARSPKRPRFALLAAGGTLVGLIAAWGLSSTRQSDPAPAPVASAGLALAAEPSAKAIELSEVPVTGEGQGQTAEIDKTASCVGAYLPKGAFGKPPELNWLCGESEPNKGAQALRVAIVGNAPKGEVTNAMKLWARLGWYDMAAFAVVRAGCCAEPKSLSLPAAGSGCEPMADSLRELSKEIVAGRSYADALKRYDGAVQCEVNQGRGALFGRAARPEPGEDTAFKEFVDAIAH